MVEEKVSLEIKGLHLSYDSRQPVLKGLNVSFRPGEFVCLLGPNGSGKSTLLKALLGLLKPSEGSLCLQGDDLVSMSAIERARRVAAVLTDLSQTEHMKARDLVSLGRFPHSKSGRKEEDMEFCQRSLESMKAIHLADRKIELLSDGERQRVFMARALAQDPSLLILDEPMSFLDYPQKIETFQLLRKWSMSGNRTILMASHDLDLCVKLADRLMVLDGMDRIYSGTPEDLILSGQLQKVFQTDHLHFNERDGRIEISKGEVRGEVSLEGEPGGLGWTRHALERVGWKIVDKSPIRIYLKNKVWSLSVGEESSQSFSLLETLLNFMNGLEGFGSGEGG